ncbi:MULTISPECIES: ATP-binding protein [unclassified Crossiella]|uniref:ATP-binding protein n=1 Tax=unclassified Crossiella TaxID=2620835 RepID=UPI001FFFDE88|nr:MULTISPECIES: ATP-binding protein [unclassified Crossiella]MCK2239984.1 ATP-binding protein [Crossiella sp. S99.2]MCK2252692.1 ATP-binding protein [Crossiella sp. S99.1]
MRPVLITDGIEVTEDAIWAWVQIPETSTYLLEEDELAQETMANSAALAALIPANTQWHLKVVWDRHRGQDYLAGWEGIDSVRAPLTQDYLELGAHRIDLNAEAGFFRRRIVLLGVAWKEEGRAAEQPGLRRRWARERGMRESLRLATRRLEMVRPEIMRWLNQAEASILRARAASASRIAWACAREMRRTIGLDLPESQLLTGGALVTLLNGQMDPTVGEDFVAVTDKVTQQTRYVSVLTAATNGFPVGELSLPGGEWLGSILTSVADVDASVRGIHYGHSGSVELLDAGRGLVRSQIREASAVGSAPLEALEAEQALEARRHEVQRRLDVQVTTHPRWVVSADTPGELSDRVTELRQHYAGTVELHRPHSIQDLLWQELMPGDVLRVPEFGQDQPMRTLAGSWFHGGSAVGDATGPYVAANLGSSPSPVQVHVVSRSQAHSTQPTTIAVTGRSGSGKSTLVLLLVMGALAEGAWVFLVDPKGDLAGVRSVAADLLGVTVQVVHVMDPGSSGMMDPMRFAPGIDEARRLTLDALLGALHPLDRSRGETVLEHAVDAVLQRPRGSWSAPAVIGELIATAGEHSAAATAREIGEVLRLRALQPSMRAVLGPASSESVPLMTSRGLVYLDMSGLGLPQHSPDPSRWSVAERCAMATYHTALAYASLQGRHVRELKKLLAVTELHLITAYPEGEALVRWVSRTGRANQLWMVLDSQAAVDMARVEGLLEQVVMTFAFAASGAAEQDAQAKLLRRNESGPSMRAALAELATGECIFRDRRGNLAPLQIDRLTRWVADGLSTTAGDDRADLLDSLAQTGQPGPVTSPVAEHSVAAEQE